MLSRNDRRIVFDSQVPCLGLLNKRGVSSAFLNSRTVVTERPIKPHCSSLRRWIHRAFRLASRKPSACWLLKPAREMGHQLKSALLVVRVPLFYRSCHLRQGFAAIGGADVILGRSNSMDGLADSIAGLFYVTVICLPTNDFG